LAEDERRRSGNIDSLERRSYEPRLALRRVQSAVLALVIITVVGIFGYVVFEGWSFTDALYMSVITLTTVGYREVRVLDTSGQLWIMLLLITGVGTLFYAAVSSVELVVEGTVRGNFDTTPSADDRLRASDTLIVLGSRGQIERLEHLMRGM
jgi:voltage-gated potassium channel Kch